MEFRYRATRPYLQLAPEDLALIDEYIKLNQAIVNPNFEPVRGTDYLFQAIYLALLNNKLPKNYIDKVHNLAINVYFYDQQKLNEVVGHGSVARFKAIMWLIEMIRIKRHDELLVYLKLSFVDDAENDLLKKVLIQKQLFHQIEQWFTLDDIKGLEVLLNTLKRSSALTDALKHEQNIDQLIQAEYIHSIDQYFTTYQAVNQYERHWYELHIDWLLKLMNNHQNKPKVKQLLVKINKDWLQFNEPALHRITGEDKEYIFRSIYSILDMMRKTNEMLYGESRYLGPCENYNPESYKLLTEKLKIIKEDSK